MLFSSHPVGLTEKNGRESAAFLPLPRETTAWMQEVEQRRERLPRFGVRATLRKPAVILFYSREEQRPRAVHNSPFNSVTNTAFVAHPERRRILCNTTQ